jgi:putative flippase GtrA
MRSLFLYGWVGAIGTAVHFAVLFATLRVAGPVLASTLGAIVGCVVNYGLASQLVFSQRSVAAGTFARFAIVATFGVAVNALVVRMLLDTLPIALNQAVASMTVLFVGYALNKRWTFDDRSN